MNRPVAVLDLEPILGEAPCWDDETETLLWVDIVGGVVHRWSPATGRDTATVLDRPVGAAVPSAGGGVALAVDKGFGLLVETTGKLEMLVEFEREKSRPNNRMNDGKCDSAGRFWAGTQSSTLEPNAGAMYRLDPDGSATMIFADVTISNGIGWSPDDTTMYYIDTALCRIDAFDFDPASGAVARRRTLVEIPPSIGDGDGLCVDAEGGIWVALWGGWALHRYTPDGALDRVVEMPVSHPTSVCFGGPGLDRLYITSARMNEKGPLSPAQLRPQPHAGAVFEFRPGVRGLPSYRFGAPSAS